ncbi:metallophosphatase [cf. Phormidesmis sp. LEGE 11477]|uniref:metallophosphoesterase family protein n=1 Tax=cf. Phormidesmis sp. LEGE 11477 TaxID=1828680 RepID=UPI001880529B|nr:metallophosphatase [cf. Phormidesmis sp. LEGE 11477]
MKWAILSGIEGNLTAYEAVLKDLRQLRQPVTELYILGDVIGLSGNNLKNNNLQDDSLQNDNEAVIRRLRHPGVGQLKPQVCVGWWEEQCFSLHGLSGLPDAPELMAAVGGDGVKALWDSVSRKSVQWLRSQHFGFYELDCLLIHGSMASYADELTPETPAIELCDRLIRADANHLFCGRSGRTFECWVNPNQLHSTVTTLDGPQPTQDQSKTPRRIVGVGSVGRTPGQATYTLYSPGSNQLSFRTVNYGQAKKGKAKGFGFP